MMKNTGKFISKPAFGSINGANKKKKFQIALLDLNWRMLSA